MRGMETSAAVLIAVAAMVGCDSKSEDKTPAPTVVVPSTADKMKDSMSKAADATKDTMSKAADATKEKAADMKDATVNGATDAKNNMVSAATDAKETIVAKAQDYYDKAKSYIDSKNMTGASDMMDKLEAIKAQLPAEWSAKVTELKDMYAKAKASLTPTTQP